MYSLALQIPSGGEWLFLAILGLLFFGKRLPEVGRSLGKGIVEFKKGLKDIGEEVDDQVAASAEREAAQHRLEEAKPKFDPQTGKPLVSAEPEAKFDPYTGKPLNPQVEVEAAEHHG